MVSLEPIRGFASDRTIVEGVHRGGVSGIRLQENQNPNQADSTCEWVRVRGKERRKRSNMAGESSNTPEFSALFG